MARQTSEQIDVPWAAIELAQKRTAFLFRHLQYGNDPLKMILASAYIQGMNDMFDALDNRGLIQGSDKRSGS